MLKRDQRAREAKSRILSPTGTPSGRYYDGEEEYPSAAGDALQLYEGGEGRSHTTGTRERRAPAREQPEADRLCARP